MTRNELIEDNMTLVYFVINTYFPSWRGNEDLIQTGMVGLCKAADTYKEGESKFSTYATKCIRNEIITEFKRNSKNVPTVSLDTMVADEDDIDFHSIIPAEYVDFDINVNFSNFIGQLSEFQRTILSDLSNGLSQFEIAEKYKVSRQWVNKLCREIRRKWRRYNGED